MAVSAVAASRGFCAAPGFCVSLSVGSRSSTLNSALPRYSSRQRLSFKTSCGVLSSQTFFSAPGTQNSGRCLKSVSSPRAQAGESGESSGNEVSADAWLGRLAMLGFFGALAVEIATGKGLLQAVGLTTPLPTAALALVGTAGVFTAFKIFRSS
eukprot:TRINITY_DN527_c0_g1_i2.p1 TRINITY_DN527_c0_g1~~TRINITY_DN527_c0_g1_i2.p1  ORF type:complete len:164 (-),score=7.63 TRINITY_DN527_c0_g1_i2:150-611(-)